MKHVLTRAAWRSLAMTLLLLTTFGGPSQVFAYGGESDSGGGGGSGESLGVGGPPNIWEIPDPEDLSGGTAGETISLETPLEQAMRKVWEGLGGKAGTGKSLSDWMKTARAGKAVKQVILEEEQEEAFGEVDRAHATVVVLEKLDQAGQAAQVAISFCPPVGAGTSVGLDAGRAFADAYNQAKEEGKTTAEAIEIGMRHAMVKGAGTVVTAGVIGNSAGKLWEKSKKIPLNRVREISKKGAHIITTAGLKVTEFGTNAGLDEVRSKVVSNTPSNQAKTPSFGPPPADFVTSGGHDIRK